MPRLVFDIETVGDDFDSFDETTQGYLTRWIKRESKSDKEYKKALESLKGETGLSPLTGQIVAIGILDCDKDKGVVYYQAPGGDTKDTEEDGIKYKPMSEKDMLESWWSGARNYQEFVSYNGRGFDVPYLMIRSAIHGIRPTKDLMRGRYMYQNAPDARHVDLYDQLTFYGASRSRGSLHLWCRAFGIESPKTQGVSGGDVGRLFKEGNFLDIAKYNVGDLWATKKLYEYWNSYLRFGG
ncbi:MAG: ribonuclease H-like domain-containing protein [Candidatus Andersenbacteria bacterium]|nr:ribonuclease H-like domain-containing protein [bacterium]MDZ4225772.1 ribonuclease H-like domain-containing protein [Candidatus Andersenbacteria bacterium]